MEKMTLGLFISNRRKNLGLSQKEIADFLAVSIPTVSKWEKDERIPDLSLFSGLAKILKVDLDSLINFKEENNNNYDLENEFNIDNFSKYFAAIRKLSGYTLITLAEKLDISYQTISKWERSESVPNIFVLKKCAEIFNVSLIELYYGKSFNFNNQLIENKKTNKKNYTFLYLIPTLIGCLIIFIGAFIAFNNANNNDNSESISNNINLENSSLISGSENISSEIYEKFDFEEVIANLSFEDKSFSYDGNLHSIYVNGEVPNGVSISYENNDHIQEGEYEVVATIKNEISSYDMSITMKATLNIIKDGKYHDVLFELLDGTYEKQVIENNKSINLFPTASKKVGYSFDKWVNKNNNETINDSTNIVNDTNIIASYVPNKYKVKYYYGEQLIKEEDATYDSNYTFLSPYINENEELLITLIVNNEEIEPGTTQVFKYSNDIVVNTTFVPTSGEFQYEISNGNKKLVKYIGNKSSVIIPSGVNTICTSAFLNNESVQNVIIPSSVATIESQAFVGLDNLKTIKIPSSVLYITGSIASFCPQVVIYCEATSKPNSWVDNWKNWNIPVYWGVSEVTFVNLNGIDYVIENNQATISKIIKEKEEFTIPNIINIKGKDYIVKTIGSYSFSFTKNILKVTLNDNIEDIKMSAFESCENLKELLLSKNLINIERSAFYKCQNLINLSIPSKVTSIDVTAFGECINIENFSVDKDNRVYDSRNDCNAIIETKTNTLFKGCKNTILPNDIVKIGDYAFSYCINLLEITFPSNIKEIGRCAFMDSGIINLTIPGTIETIDENAFYHCLNLGSVKVESGVKKIKTYAFGCCFSLYSAIISNGVEVIEKNIFDQCSYLQMLEVPITKEVYDSKAGLGYYFDEKYCLNDGSNLSMCLDYIKINGGVIKNETFSKLSGVKHIIIGSDVEAIDGIYLPSSGKSCLYFECAKGEEPSSYDPGDAFEVYYKDEWYFDSNGFIKIK